MTCARPLVLMALAASLFAPAAVRAQTALPDSLLYVLNPPTSDFAWGCFAPCMCPILVQSRLSGSFILRRANIGPLYTSYDVLDVRWKTISGAQPVSITGSGRYRLGGESDVREQLTLELSFDGGVPQHFDSGLHLPGAPFPAIATHISLHGEFCHDSVLAVDARPLAAAAVSGQPILSTLTLAPNPFSGSTEVSFALPRDENVDLGVFDITGRRVRRLAEHERFAAGAYLRVWDGRFENGTAARPGLYLVRLHTSAGLTTRMVTKLR